MSAGTTPKQGDHVTNDIGLALMRPFESIRSLRSEFVDGQHFLYDYLLHAYSLARKMAESPVLLTARTLAASAGAEENALREINNLRTRYPAMARLNQSVLRDVHLRNSREFGSGGMRFETEILAAIQQSLENALAPGHPGPAVGRRPNPSIACQQMLRAAYDPAAALVVVAAHMALEPVPAQSAFHGVIAEIAETLDRPGMWRDPYAQFHEERPSTTGKIIRQLQEVLMQIEILSAQSLALAGLIKGEIGHKGGSPAADAHYGAMLHLLHARLQQMR